VLHALLPETSKILDAGGGTGFYSLPLAARGHDVTVLDLSREMLVVAEEESMRLGLADRVQTMLGDMEETGLPSSGFDVTMCHLALCHANDPLRALREFNRVLRDDGLLSLVVENSLFFSMAEAYKGNLALALERLKQRDLRVQLSCLGSLRTFSRDEIISLLDEAGFKPIRVMGLRVLGDYLLYLTKSEPENLRSLKEIEELLCEMDRVNTIGRFHFIVSRKM
jgi:S-adenosylmethionine-dependent methyltransferase